MSVIIVSGLSLINSINFAAAPSGTNIYVISGYVFDPSGKAVSGAFVYNSNSSGLSVGPGYYSDSSGFYYMAVPAGTYRIVARGLDGSGTSYSQSNIVVNSDVTININLVPGFIISGYILDSSGKPIAGVQTNVYNSSWSVPVVHTTSSGYYTIFAAPGTYTFIIWPPANTNIVYYNDPAFVVNSSTTKNITLASGFKISGYVRYPSGEVVPGVYTWLTTVAGTPFNQELGRILLVTSLMLFQLEPTRYLPEACLVQAQSILNLIL